MRLCRAQFGHKPIGRLLNDLIRPPQKRRRDRQAERLRGFQVDDQLELSRPESARLEALFTCRATPKAGGRIIVAEVGPVVLQRAVQTKLSTTEKISMKYCWVATRRCMSWITCRRLAGSLETTLAHQEIGEQPGR